ncbi:MAG TPA: hypothetical protein VG675_05520 [Bryobacteraceae bacterium]|nr:hypothetical protein [Bryobacteraceae bacterium]
MQTRQLPLFAALAMFVVPAFAQSLSATTTKDGEIHGTMHMSPPRFGSVAIAGKPYSAQRVSERVQTAADGTHFTMGGQQETMYRDSEGRTRTERPMVLGPRISDAPMVIEILDPVDHVGYTLDTQNKVAHRYALPAPPARQPRVRAAGVAGGGGGGSLTVSSASTEVRAAIGGAPPVAAPAQVRTVSPFPRPEMTHEDLGTQIIEGVPAKGQRMVEKYPQGTMGSDRPFQVTSETWVAPDLGLVVLSKTVDPRSGENTMKLINIDRSEPSPTLFMAPPDYTVVDETGPFEIQWVGKQSQ